MYVLIRLLFIITGALCFFEDSPNVVNLTKNNFHMVTKDDKIWLVNFYAPWCSHCRRFVKEFEAVADELKGKFNIGAVDVTKEKELKKMYGIRRFPTLLIFDDDKTQPITYKGRRRSRNIILTMLRKDYKNMSEEEEEE